MNRFKPIGHETGRAGHAETIAKRRFNVKKDLTPEVFAVLYWDYD